MKRTHRKTHVFIWLVLGPAIIAVLLLAVLHRPADPVNESLPDVLREEAR